MRSIALLFVVFLTTAAAPVIDEQHRRSPEQTYLTVPEWFLVFSPEEYATYLRNEPPSRFPFMGHVGQFWQSYGAVIDATEDYPPNYPYHVMVGVIGTSTTAEYSIKGFYEALIGRFTELISGRANTAEDRLAAQTAQDYVDFIKHTPWYEFDFVTPLGKLWTETGFGGENLWRKWERKYALTTEYAVKAGYAWLIGAATRAGYEPPISETHVILLKDNKQHLMTLPRYQAFTNAASEAALHGADFVEIAGNRGEILVTLISSENWSLPAPAATLYEQKILTDVGKKRVAAIARVSELAEIIRSIEGADVLIEHIYDY